MPRRSKREVEERTAGPRDADVVERERRRLRWAFGVALLAASSPAAMQACAQTSAEPRPDASTGKGDDSAASGPGSDAATDGGADGTGEDDLDCSAFRGAGCNTLVYADALFVPDGTDAEICPIVLPCGLPPSVKAEGCTIVDSMNGTPIGCQVVAGCTADVFQPGPCGAVGLQCYCDIFVGGGRRAGSTPALPPSESVGRRASGSRASRRRAADTSALGAYFARMAEEETASIHAFDLLARDLARLEAPAELVRAAQSARDDEVHHARAMTRLARRHDARPSRPRAGRREHRTLESLALENAVEGCARETYGALLATWQSLRATDPTIRALFARVAADETRHAALAWAIAAWAEARLDARGRARVLRARREALRELSQQARTAVPREMSDVAGFPQPPDGRALLAALAASL